MSLQELPARVRRDVYLTWAGMGIAAAGLIGFMASFVSVAGPSRWAGDVHSDTPWLAWISIFTWVAGMIITWYGRKRVERALRERKRELADAARVDLD